jgi:hypothetical protein
MTEPLEGFAFRDAIRTGSPRWLRSGRIGKAMYSFGLMMDLLGDAVAYGVRARFPGQYTNETLDMTGRERGIRRGLYESATDYAERLRHWHDAHLFRGGPYAMLEQLYEHFRPNNFQIDLVYMSGLRFVLDTSGNVTRDHFAWNPPPPPTKWARWWLFYHWPIAPMTDGLWGDPGAPWGCGGVWGAGFSAEVVDEFRLVPTDWNAAHCLGHVVLLPSGAQLYDYPIAGPGVGTPVVIGVGYT